MQEAYNDELLRAAVVLNSGDYSSAVADLFAAATELLAMMSNRAHLSRATADSLFDETVKTTRASYAKMTRHCK